MITLQKKNNRVNICKGKKRGIIIFLLCGGLSIIMIVSFLYMHNRETYQLELVKNNHEYTGKGISIAILDSGIRREYKNEVVNNINFTESESEYDENGHGTYMFQIIHDIEIGVAKDAEISVLKVASEECSSESGDVVEAIRWCIEQDIQVISMSLSTSKDDEELHGVIKEAYDNGIHIIASVSNDSCFLSYPASYDEVMGVYSWRGKESYQELGYIYCPVNEYTVSKRCDEIIQGNSPATAFIAGLTAQILEEGIAKEIVMSNDDVEARLLEVVS